MCLPYFRISSDSTFYSSQPNTSLIINKSVGNDSIGMFVCISYHIFVSTLCSQAFLKKHEIHVKYRPAIKIASQLESCNLLSLLKKKRVKTLLVEIKIIKKSRSQPEVIRRKQQNQVN